MSTTLQTKFGPILVVIQNGDTAFVRAGEATHYDETDEMPPALEIGRGVAMRVHHHYTYNGSTWENSRHTYRSTGLHRAVDGTPSFMLADPTPAMIDRTHDAIIAALNEHDFDADMSDAAETKRQADAREYRALAEQLRATAAELDASARALTAGGDLLYFEASLTSGVSESCKRVRTASGELLAPIGEPPTVYGASKYAHRGNVREWTQK